MTLETLFSHLNVDIPKSHAADDIDSVSYDSRICADGTLFVCIRGAASDGHKYARDAYDRGCRAFLAEEPLELPGDAAVILCDNTQKMLALVSAELCGRPADKLRIIGITGTKGKTTSALLIYSIMNEAGIPTGYIGSVGVMFAGRRTSTLRTTPESADLHQYFHKMLAAGITTVVMEVSSQAIYRERVYGMTFDTCAYTNLSPDHIGGVEHPTFEHYRDCKARLFSDFGCGFIVYNADDKNADYMLRDTSALTSSYSMHDASADYYGSDAEKWCENGALGVDFTLRAGDEKRRIRLRSPGDFSVYNALLAIAVCRRYGVSYDTITKALADATPLGRFEVVNALPYATFVIDFAHNELSLRSALSVLREYEPKRLIVLVGSVGGRTFSRRAPIGRAISEFADLCVLTADDPDYEDPMDIIHDILEGFGDSQTPFVCIPDRRAAVEYVVENAREGDIVLLAGKGHENFILIEGEHRPFSERSIILEAASKLGAGV